mmetsp:Transcript_97768/g.169324  ORF Transcript_97768/g.169324 Transcript_97768/m.169324 type:complete len:139 (-) Transcript_97768:361-777(-)
MRTTALILALLACAGHGRRVQAAQKEVSEDALSPLAALLLAGNPAAGFASSAGPLAGSRASMRPVARKMEHGLAQPSKLEGKALSEAVRRSDVKMYVGEITDQMIYNALLLAAAAGAMALRLGLTLKESYDNDPFALD